MKNIPVLVISYILLGEVEQQALSEIGKWPLGFDGEFKPVFLINESVPHDLPLSIEMYREVLTPNTPLEQYFSEGEGVVIEFQPILSKHLTVIQSKNIEVVNGGTDIAKLKTKLYAALKKIEERKNPKPVLEIINQTPQQETKRLKFLQIASFYPEYLEQIYSKNSSLQEKSFNDQGDFLVEDRFTGAHILAPYLGEFGYDTTLIVTNALYRQAVWCNENGQMDALTPDWQKEIVRRQIETIKPDIIYTIDPIEFDSRFFSTVSHKPKILAGWRAAPIAKGTDWSTFDLILSNLSGVREIAKKLGATDAVEFSPGFPVELVAAVGNCTSETDVVFSGQWTAGHDQRNRYMTAVAQAAINERDFTASFYVGGDVRSISHQVAALNRGPQYGIPYYRSLKSGNITLDARGSGFTWHHPETGTVVDFAGAEGGSMRLVEATGMGASLICEEHAGMDRYFTPGVDVVTFKGERDLLDKIRYYKSRDAERHQIATAGQKRCHTEHSMQARARQFVSIVSQIESPRDSRPETVITTAQPAKEERKIPAAETLTSAIQLLQSGSPAKALSILEQVECFTIPDTNYIAGLCLAQLGRWQEAEKALIAEISINPNCQDAKNILDEVVRPALSMR